MKLNTEVVLLVVFVVITFLFTSCVCREGSPPATHTSIPTDGPPATTCTPVPTVVELGSAYGIPCKPPCWQGLIPGESTSQEVERGMERMRLAIENL